MDNTIQSSPNAIMCTDMNGNIIMWNKGAEETLGYKASDVIGKMNVVGNLYTGSMARKARIRMTTIVPNTIKPDLPCIYRCFILVPLVVMSDSVAIC